MTYYKVKVKSSGEKAVLIIDHSDRKYIRQMLPYPKLTIGFMKHVFINPLNAELNPICCLLALLGAHHFLHVSRIRVKSLTLRLLMSYIYIYIYIYIWSTYS